MIIDYLRDGGLAILLTLNVWLSVRVLRTSSFQSLLGWHIIVFYPIMAVGCWIIPGSRYDVAFNIPVKKECIETYKTALILCGLIAVAYLTALVRIQASGKPLGRPKIGAPPNPWSVRAVLTYGTIVIGAGVLLSSNSVEHVVSNLRDILTLKSYEYYYIIRGDLISISNPWYVTLAEVVVMKGLLPLVNLSALYLRLRHRGSGWGVVWLGTVVIWAICCIVALQKTPILELVVGTVAIFLATRLRKSSATEIGFFIVACVLAFTVVVVLLYNALGYSGNLRNELLVRILCTPYQTAIAHFAVFPDYHPFTYFSSSRTMNLLLAAGLKPKLTLDYVTPYHIASIYTLGGLVNLNTSILGNGWGEFGYYGVFISSVILFGICFAIDRWVSVRFERWVLVPFVIFFMSDIISVVNNDLLFLVTAHGLVVVPAALWWFYPAPSEKRQMRGVRKQATRVLGGG